MHLLIADDEAALAAIVARVAKKAGWQTTTAESAAALEQALEAGHPDALVLDLQLGSVSGAALLRILALAGFRGPVALISGNDERSLQTAHDQGQALGLAVGAALQKPFGVGELKRVQTAGKSVSNHRGRVGRRH